MPAISLILAAFVPLGAAVQIRERFTNGTSTEECPALNQLPGLVPRKGRLLGTIKASGSDERRIDMFQTRGFKVPETHIYRFYRDLDKAESWLDDEWVVRRREVLDQGKIIWLDVQPPDWKLCVEGGCDGDFKLVAQVLSSIKPAKAFLSIGHEVDHDWPDMTGGSEEYVKMFHRAKDVISKNGGDNAVWKYVISNQVLDLRDDSKAWNNALARWPGDNYVDWVGFNIYLKYAKDNKDGTGTYVYGETYYTYEREHSLRGQLKALTKKFTEVSKPGLDFASKTWALTTVGVHSNDFGEDFNDFLGNENLGVPDEFRIEFMKELTLVAESDKFQQFKAISYFDSGDCLIDDGHNDVLVEPFSKFSNAQAFAMNHQCE